ncbi:tigger transposable element-derived protein 1 isoform X7 [Cherax quadricarinatus]|uniref:tigger transposable element-derived protein 1 isoform X7 n=1 Tax=Cherax quadricarinatus TaxID=27406 RepID=UPI00387EA148
MGPKKVPSKVSLVKKVRNTMEFKKEVIDKYESGMRVLQLARMYGKNKSTISSILAKKEQIKEADVAKGVTMLTKKRSQALEDVEKLLLVWIKEKQLAGDSVVEAIICKMARQLHADLVKKMPGASADVSEFKASRGWFERFKKRSGIHNVVKHGEAASSDKPATEEFVDEFKEYIEVEGFLPKQVFSCDETGLFWKKMPKRTYITQEEKALPGHKPMKDRLTLLFCGNASGDFKVKPLLVYHTENPQVFKKNNVIKSKLCVMWKANNTAWVTRQIFVDWVIEVFGPSVKKYLQENKLPLKCLLVLDSAPAHPPDLEDQLLEEYSFIRVKFLPPDTTPPIQPMNQQVISNFKKLYTKAVFERCFEVTSGTELTLREFWRNHFTILHCISLIDKAWQEVTSRTINSSWRKLWPECVLQKDLEGFEADHDDPTPVVESVVSLGKSMGLDVSDQDVEELVDDHTEELTTKELQELHLEKQQIAAEEIASEEEERRENVSSSVIKDICAKWSEVQSFVEKYHPNKAVASRVCNMFNDNALSHFRQILKRRQKQTSLDRFFVQQASSDSQGGLSASKRQTREVTSPPPSPLLTVFDIPRGVINKGVLRCKPEREKISKFAHCESQDKFGTRFKCKTEGPMKIGQPMDVDVCDDTNTYIDDDLIEVKDEQIKMEDWVDNGDCYKMCGDNEDRKDVVTNLHRLDDTSTDISRETTNYSQDIDVNDNPSSFIGVKDEPIELEDRVDNSNNMTEIIQKIIPNLLLVNAKATDKTRETTYYSQAADTKNTMPKDGQVRRKKTQSKDEGSVADSTGHIYIMDLRPAKIAQRSRIIRMSERGFSPMDIARRLGISRHTVYTWLNRWEEDRNLYDRARSGAPKKTSAEQDESIKEAAVTNPSTNAMKIREKLNLKVTPRTVRNRLHAAGIQPTLVVKERLKGKTRLQSSEH